MRRADTQAPSTPISTWFSPIATSRPVALQRWPIRVTSDNARAGTIACAAPAAPGRSAVLTDNR